MQLKKLGKGAQITRKEMKSKLNDKEKKNVAVRIKNHFKKKKGMKKTKQELYQ